MKKLRFAPLIRVSTEKQERQGESLNTQKKQIEHYVKALGGAIPERCWRYSGQEHSTPGYERKKLDELLNDATKGLFDAVIVADASRWSRNNLKSEQGLDILKKNNIRFFVGQTEYDLYNPEQKFSLALFTNVNEMVAMQNALKSMQNRIERAKQNIPTVPHLPFGRTFDRKTNKWGLDKEKVALIKQAADRYLQGVGFVRLHKEVGITKTRLWKILSERSGPEWQIHFKSERLNIDETVTLKIPPLLPQKTIKAIRKQAEANKTYTHGQGKNKYLLGRMIFCQKCGQALSGTCNHGYRYYRHPRNDCRNFYNVRADEIETNVFWSIYWMVGDKTGFEKAIKDAVPDTKDIEKAIDRLNQIAFELRKVDTQKNRLVDAVAEGTLDNDTVKSKMNNLKSREAVLNDEKQSLKAKIENQPSKDEIENRFKWWQTFLRGEYELNDEHMLQMSFDEKRLLLQALFSGTDEKNQRFGVYIERDLRREYPFYWEIRGNIPYVNDGGWIGHYPIYYDTDQEGEGLVKAYNKLFEQFSRNMRVAYT